MLKNQLITPEGTKDDLFEEASVCRRIAQRLCGLFEKRGFAEVVTPGLEFLDVFSVEGHSIPTEYMFKLTDPKGRLLVIRPDSTLPIARLCATRLKGELLPLRLYYNQAVYSSNPALRGRSDEVKQAGVELIGVQSKLADLEILSLALKSLEELGSPSFRLEIGHIGFFNILADSLCLDAAAREELRLLIEVKNYPAVGDILDRFSGRKEALILKQLPRLFGGEEVFRQASALIENSEAAPILSYLQQLYESLQKLGLGDQVSVDLGIVNRTDYYTGVVFKGYLEGYGEPILSGGRYDRLLASFGEEAPAIGFAVHIDAAARTLMREQEVRIPPAERLIFAEPGREMEAIHYLNELTSQGVKAELSLFSTWEESLEYAEKRGISRLEKPGLSSSGGKVQ